MGVLYIHSPKSPGPFPKLPKKLKIKKEKKKGQFDPVQVSTRDRRATAGRRVALGQRPGIGDL
jgi:hypothetical protein